MINNKFHVKELPESRDAPFIIANTSERIDFS